MIEKIKRVGCTRATFSAFAVAVMALLAGCATPPREVVPPAPAASAATPEAGPETASIVSIRPVTSANAPAATLRVLGIGTAAQPEPRLRELVLRRPDGRSFTLVQPEDATLSVGASVILAGPEGERRAQLKPTGLKPN